MIRPPFCLYGLIPFGMSGLKYCFSQVYLRKDKRLIPFGMSGLKLESEFEISEKSMSHPVWDEWIEMRMFATLNYNRLKVSSRLG